MKFRVLLVGLFLVASASAAVADGPYIGVSGGVSILHDSDVINSHTITYDTGYGINASLGYNFKPIRAEFEFGYKQSDLDKVSGPVLNGIWINSDLTVMSYMVNVYYDINTKTPLTPYVGVGLGVIDGEFNFNGFKANDTVFGYQVAAGAAYSLNKNIALDLSYRLQGAADDLESNGFKASYMSSNIMAGIRYNF